MQERTGKLIVIVALPALILAILVFVTIEEQERLDACATGGPAGSAVGVDIASVPTGPIAGYGHAELVNAAHIMLAARELSLSLRDQKIGVMTAIGESGLRVLDYGDAAGPDSRGLFQQRANGAWGSLQDRMDPKTSATNFFRALQKVTNRDTLEPTIAAHRTQRNADPYHYRRYWAAADEIVEALGGVRAATPAPATVGGGAGSYHLGNVQPQLEAMVAVLGPRFNIATVGGYRASATDPGGHPAGLAADLMTGSHAQGDALAAYAMAHASDLAIDYIIWDQQIWSVARAAEGWRPMADRGSPTANHKDHVHINVTADGAAATTGDPSTIQAATQKCAADTSGAWQAPLEAPVTSDYGPRTHPVDGGASFHDGVDYGASCATPFKAAGSGVVVKASPDTIYGHQIVIDHGGGTLTKYGHMYADGVLVAVGDRVSAGQVIGKVGSAGLSTGCHLHWTVEVDGKTTDPLPWLDEVKQGATIATFNALGHSHTRRGGNKKGWAGSAERTRGLVRYLTTAQPQILGLQEFQPPQQRVFRRATGAAWGTHAIRDNVVAWRTDTYALVSSTHLTIPYFGGSPRRMPVAILRDKANGSRVAVISIHNPADVRGGNRRHRARAVQIERRAVARLQARGIPAIVLGDFNSRRGAFCAATAGGLMTAANGGANTGRCRPPAGRLWIDWLFGAGIQWSRYQLDHGPRGTLSDHPYVSAQANW